MGSYAYLSVGNYPLFSTKHVVDPTALMLFTEGDKQIRRLTAIEAAQYFGESEEFNRELAEDGTEADEECEYQIVEYTANLAVVKDRLDLMGYTLPRVRKEFDEGIKERIAELIGYNEDPAFPNSEELRTRWDNEIELLREVDLDRWLEAFVFILAHDLRPGYAFRDSGPRDGSDLPRLVCYLLGENWTEGVWTPFFDARSSIRAVVEVTGLDLELVYDLTELVSSGELDPEEDLCGWARRQTADEFVINHKLVVLTEGSSDKWVLEGAFQLLYPHLVGYYSFMDFEAVKVQGGAGPLVSVVKSFIGAGIVNRTVALFDNDTAARDALRGMKGVTIPENFRVMHYPDVEWARSYPTLGPQGTINMDVNGLAGSLEMYFGMDVLRRPDGSLTPVQWRGYIDGVGRYQGELIEKTQLQKRFREKLKVCREDPDAAVGFDWSGMRAILEKLRIAFHEPQTPL